MYVPDGINGDCPTNPTTEDKRSGGDMYFLLHCPLQVNFTWMLAVTSHVCPQNMVVPLRKFPYVRDSVESYHFFLHSLKSQTYIL